MGFFYRKKKGLRHAETRQTALWQPGWFQDLTATVRRARASSRFRPPEVLTKSELLEAEEELKALQRHALGIVDPQTR